MSDRPSLPLPFELSETPPDLAEVIAAWPTLPEPSRHDGDGPSRLGGSRPGTGADPVNIEPPTFIRWVRDDEPLDAFVNEAKARTWVAEAEHALLTLATGERPMVRGDATGSGSTSRGKGTAGPSWSRSRGGGCGSSGSTAATSFPSGAPFHARPIQALGDLRRPVRQLHPRGLQRPASVSAEGTESKSPGITSASSSSRPSPFLSIGRMPRTCFNWTLAWRAAS